MDDVLGATTVTTMSAVPSARTTSRLALILLLAPLLTACANTRQLQVASAGSTGCAPTDVRVSQVRSGVGTRSWIAQCAGDSFQCSMVGEGNTSCAPVRGRGRGASEVSRADVARQEALLRRQGPRFQFSRHEDVLRGVRATFETEVATLVFTFAPERDRDSVQLSLAAPGEETLAGCEEFVLVDERRALLRAPLADGEAQLPRAALVTHTQADPAPIAQFCGRAWPLRRADVYGFERFAEHMNEALEGHEPSPASAGAEPAPSPASVGTEPAPVVDESVARAVRALLDEQAALLRGCAGAGRTEVLPVEATWDAAGAIRVHVRGREDQAVHDCATSVLRRQHAPGGAAGRLIHVLAP